MKKLLVLLFVIFSIFGKSQDTTAVSPPTAPKIITCEFGGNVTLLLKQVFNLSNNTFPTLPYDVTYKRIHDNKALRMGLGITVNNSSVKTTETSTNQTVTQTGPDPIIPTTTIDINLFYRIGWEKRFEIEKRVMAYFGVDLITQYGYSDSKSCFVFNNLPNSYNYTSTSDNINKIVAGAGPVAGIQFFITKKISVLTEMPLYFSYTYQNESTVDFHDQSSFNSGFIKYENRQTIVTNGTNLKLTLPVTLYLCIKL